MSAPLFSVRYRDVPGIPWVVVPRGVVIVPLDDTRSVHSTLLIRCETGWMSRTGETHVEDDGKNNGAEDEAQIHVHGI